MELRHLTKQEIEMFLNKKHGRGVIDLFDRINKEDTIFVSYIIFGKGGKRSTQNYLFCENDENDLSVSGMNEKGVVYDATEEFKYFHAIQEIKMNKQREMGEYYERERLL